MTVLPGEGTHPILYGSLALQSGLRTLPAYQARPDVGGRFPAVLAVPDEGRIAPWFKALCRSLARHGMAVVAPGAGRVVTVPDLDHAFEYVASRDTGWIDHAALGIIGIGSGGPAAIRYAATRPGVDALVLIAATIDPVLADVAVPLLGVYGRDGQRVTVDQVMDARRLAGHGEWVLYEGVADSFLDDSSSDYHGPASRDVLGRVRAFLADRLIARVG